MRPGWLVVLCGCGAPISNVPFLEEAQFVGILPTSDRLGAPAEIAAATDGDPVLAEARAAAAAYQGLVDLPTLVGDHLKTLGPSTREEHLRTWEPSRIRVPDAPEELGLPDGELVFFAQAEVERPARGGGDLLLTIELGPTRGGPWQRVAEGVWDGEGRGELSFDLAAAADALDLLVTDPLGLVTASFDDHGLLDSERAVELVYTLTSGEAASFVVGGSELLSFGGLLEVTDDAQAWPGYATVVHRGGVGGYASGAVFRGAEEIGFVRCWDALGVTVHARGDAGVVTSGDRAACVEGAP